MQNKTRDTKERVKQSIEKVQGTAEELLSEAEQSVKATLDNSQAAAQRTMESAQTKLHSLERAISPAIDDLAARAQKICNQGIDLCARESERIRNQLLRTTESTKQYVTEQPGRSLLIAAFAGAALAAAFLLHRRR